MSESCACGGAPDLIFPCSGAADVGELADKAARKMTGDNRGRMYCLAGVGGRVKGILKMTGMAGSILAINGCQRECATHCLEQAGFEGFESVNITDLGFRKGRTDVDAETVAATADRLWSLGKNAGSHRKAEAEDTMENPI